MFSILKFKGNCYEKEIDDNSGSAACSGYRLRCRFRRRAGDLKYIGNGKEVVLFAETVVRTNQSIIVRDSRGNKLPAQIIKTRGKEVTLRVPNVRKDEQYTFELGGVNVGKNRDLRYSNYFFVKDNWRNNKPEPNARGP